MIFITIGRSKPEHRGYLHHQRRVQLMAPSEGDDSRPVPSAPSAVRRLAPSPPRPQGASPFHQCTLPPTGLMALKRGSYPNVSGVTRGSGIRLLPAPTVSWRSQGEMPCLLLSVTHTTSRYTPTALLRATHIFIKDTSITLIF